MYRAGVCEGGDAVLVGGAGGGVRVGAGDGAAGGGAEGDYYDEAGGGGGVEDEGGCGVVMMEGVREGRHEGGILGCGQRNYWGFKGHSFGNR